MLRIVSILSTAVALAAEISGLYCDTFQQRTCDIACRALTARFGSRVHFPPNDTYTFWDSKQQEAHPRCRAEPTSSSEVAYAVQVLVQTGCRFAIKGGGHSRELDDSNSVGGATLDLQLMRSVSVAPDRSRVRLGSGHTLLSAYRGLEPLGLTFVGGRVDSVGLAGYTLGGGYSNLSPRYGLAMDNVFEYEIVLANASIVRVKERQHADLFFALRGGGGNNFGVVTHFTVRAVEQGLVWGGERRYQDRYGDAILSHLHDLTTRHKNETNAAFWGTLHIVGKLDRISWAVNQENALPVEFPSVFSGVNALPYTSSSLRLDIPSNFSIETAKASPRSVRNIFATITHIPSIDMKHRIARNLRDQSRTGRFAGKYATSVVWQPLFEGAIRAMKTRGGNAIDVQANGPLEVVLLIVTWEKAEDDEAAYALARRWVTRAYADARSLGVYHPYKYINYVSRDQNAFAGYSKGNLERLRAIQRKVDPRGVFTSRGLCRGYFKLR